MPGAHDLNILQAKVLLLRELVRKKSCDLNSTGKFFRMPLKSLWETKELWRRLGIMTGRKQHAALQQQVWSSRITKTAVKKWNVPIRYVAVRCNNIGDPKKEISKDRALNLVFEFLKLPHDVTYESVTSVSCGTVVHRKLFITQNVFE